MSEWLQVISAIKDASTPVALTIVSVWTFLRILTDLPRLDRWWQVRRAINIYLYDPDEGRRERAYKVLCALAPGWAEALAPDEPTKAEPVKIEPPGG